MKWLKITQFLLGKLQITVVEDQNWELTWTKERIWNHWVLHGKNSNFTGSFSWGCFMWHRLSWFLWCCFWSPYFARSIVDRVVKLVLFVSVTEADVSPAPTLRNSLLLFLLPPPLVLHNSLPNSFVTDVCWFSSVSPFAMFAKPINDCTISFGGILTIHDSREMHRQPAVFTVLANWLFGRFVSFSTLNFISKQVKIDSGKTLRGVESPRYEVSENNFRFDGSSIL